MDPILAFQEEVKENIDKLGKDSRLKELTNEWIAQSGLSKYQYNFSWMGRPIIQFPQDIIMMQELIWKIQPDCIIETGIAHGGSLIFYASMLKLLDFSNGTDSGSKVIGIDIDIRKHNREKIEQHPMYEKITMIEGSSIDSSVVEKVYKEAEKYSNPLVIFDSCHTHDHVLNECRAYSPLVKKGGYMVVMDTGAEMYYRMMENMVKKENLPNNFERPWGIDNNPLTAVRSFLNECDRFVIDESIDNKLQITACPNGYLRCIK